MIMQQLGLSKQGQHAVNKVREVQEWRQKSLAAIDKDITTPLLGVDRTWGTKQLAYNFIVYFNGSLD
jgi:hypothetical protein